MLYPIISYEDGTEVTASKPDESGNVSVYIEKFDEEMDAFKNIQLLLPEGSVTASHGYTAEEVSSWLDNCLKIKDDIISYVYEKEKMSA